MASSIFDIGAGISTAIGLLGFAVAAWLAWSTNKSRQETKRLEMLPEDDRVKIVDDMLTRYGIDGQNMKRDDKFTLIREEMHKRFAAKKLTLIVIAVSCLLCFAIAVAATLWKGAADAKAEIDVAAAKAEVEADKKAEEETRKAHEEELDELKSLLTSLILELTAKEALNDMLQQFGGTEEQWTKIKEQIDRVKDSMATFTTRMAELNGNFLLDQQETHNELLKQMETKRLALDGVKELSASDAAQDVEQIKKRVTDLDTALRNLEDKLRGHIKTLRNPA